MARQELAVGTNANDGTGDTLRAAMIKVNEMFTEVYNSPGISADTISISGNDISAVRSNDDLVFTPSGTGSVRTNALSFNGNNIEGVRSNDDINLVPSGTGSVLLAGIRINDNNIPAYPGNNLILSIDSKLQQFSKNLLTDQRGVILVSNVDTGDILSMVSNPSYNLDIYRGETTDSEWRDLLSNDFHQADQRKK